VTPSKPELDAAASALNSGAIHLLRSLGAVDRQAGLTPARLSALSVLVFGGPCTLGALAAAEGVAGPTMTRIVDGLIGAGLAERRPHPADRRAVSIAATASGDALMRAAQRRRIDALAAAVASLPPAAQRQLTGSAGLLDQVAAAVRAQSAGRAKPDRAGPEASADSGAGSGAASGARARRPAERKLGRTRL
jgi:DNA-binding MarR family transcriptional regulator